MQHYRTKPQVIQAIQLTETNIEQVSDFINKDPDQRAVIWDSEIHFGHRFSRKIYPNDWVVKTPSGDFIKKTNEEFNEIYEHVSASI